MSSIPQTAHKMAVKPVRRNSTIRRPLPVIPPVPPLIPSYIARPLHPEFARRSSKVDRSYQQTSPCAKIIVEDKENSTFSSPSSNGEPSQQRKGKILSNIRDSKSYLNCKPLKSIRQEIKSSVNVTNSSLVILNHFDEPKINTKEYFAQKQKRNNKKPRKKLEETKVLQVFTRYVEELPRSSAASNIFRKLRTLPVPSDHSKICDLENVNRKNHGCEKDGNPDIQKAPSSIYETQEFSLWLSDDGDHATEEFFFPSIGIVIM